jgi:type II secretory pathway pseudopilin PulG
MDGTPMNTVMRRRTATPGSDARSRRSDSGYTLVEMLVAMCLMSTIVLAIMGGMWGVIRASRQNDGRAKVQAALGVAADSLVSSTPHIYCPQLDDKNTYLVKAQLGATSVGWPAASVQIVKYQYWDPAARAWADTNSNQSGGVCNPQVGFTPNKTMQKITVQATSPNGEYVGTLEVVKSDIRAKPAA